MTLNRPLVEISGVPYHVDGQRSDKFLSFSVSESDFVLLEGPNGSGKTSLLNFIAGLHRPTIGEVLIRGRDVAVMTASERLIWRRSLGLIPSCSTLFDGYTVLENLRLSAQILGDRKSVV